LTLDYGGQSEPSLEGRCGPPIRRWTGSHADDRREGRELMSEVSGTANRLLKRLSRGMQALLLAIVALVRPPPFGL